MKVEKGAGQWRGLEGVHQGDLVRIEATPGGASHFELRIYRAERELLVRCPGSPAPACQTHEDKVDVSLRIPSLGDYQVVLLVSPSPLPPPLPAGSLDADLGAVHRAGGRMAVNDSIDVN